MIDDVVTGYVGGATQDFPEEWDLEALWTALRQIYPVSVDPEVLEKQAGGRDDLDPDELIEVLKKTPRRRTTPASRRSGEEIMRELERRVVLSVLDRKWREHLYEMDYLREGIDLRAYSQRDPLVEYQREGFDMFAAMMDGIKEESVGFLFNLEVQVEHDQEVVEEAEEVVEPMREPLPGAGREVPHIDAKGLDRPQQPTALAYSAPSEDGEVEVRAAAAAADEYAGIGRNADCPCGSGKKFKKCHGAPGGPTGLTTRIS